MPFGYKASVPNEEFLTNAQNRDGLQNTQVIFPYWVNYGSFKHLQAEWISRLHLCSLISSGQLQLENVRTHLFQFYCSAEIWPSASIKQKYLKSFFFLLS